MLDELGAGDKPRLVAFNKADLLDRAARDGETPAPAIAGSVLVSALTGYGMDTLRAEIAALLASLWVDVDVACRTRPASCSRASASAARSSSSTASATCASQGRVAPSLAGELEAVAARWAEDLAEAKAGRPPNDERPAPSWRAGARSTTAPRHLDGRRGSPGPALARGRRPRRRGRATRSCSRPGVDGRFSHLELARAGGLLTLHPEGDGTLHGNHVDPRGRAVRHVVGLPFAPDDVLLDRGSPLSAAAIAWRLASSVPEGASATSAGVVVRTSGELDAVSADRRRATRVRALARRRWSADRDRRRGLPVLAGGESRPLEVD